MANSDKLKTKMNWKSYVISPNSFSFEETRLLDSAPASLFGILLGEATPSSKEEKNILINCTRSLPADELEEALAKFYKQSRKRKIDRATDSTPEIDYDKISSGGGHGNKNTRLREQKKDRWGDPYR
jgi:uncharacterized protein YifE (UPF0438 family)